MDESDRALWFPNNSLQSKWRLGLVVLCVGVVGCGVVVVWGYGFGDDKGTLAPSVDIGSFLLWESACSYREYAGSLLPSLINV
jgi:hypothetical protein